MILGVGTDLCDIRRIERTLGRFGERFETRICVAEELARVRRRPHPASALAQLFAAKEACTKALGTGLRQGVWFTDIKVGKRPSGQPFLTLSGNALRRCHALTPPGMVPQLDVSLTDEYPIAHAIVILSAVPPERASQAP